MKTFDVGQADLSNCISVAQKEPIVFMQSGEPVALLVGVDGLDREQIELGASSEFWKMIKDRRQQATLSKAELMKRLATPN